jgi:hypothetical protein
MRAPCWEIEADLNGGPALFEAQTPSVATPTMAGGPIRSPCVSAA